MSTVEEIIDKIQSTITATNKDISTDERIELLEDLEEYLADHQGDILYYLKELSAEREAREKAEAGLSFAKGEIRRLGGEREHYRNRRHEELVAREKAEAACATMRELLTRASEVMHIEGWNALRGGIEAALATDAGREHLERMARKETQLDDRRAYTDRLMRILADIAQFSPDVCDTATPGGTPYQSAGLADLLEIAQTRTQSESGGD